MQEPGTEAQATPVGPATEVTRKDLHLRRIELRGCERSDGLFEVEGRLCDTKPFDFTPPACSTFPADQPIHQMGVRLVYDLDMVVHAVETFTTTAPFPVCPEAGRALQALKGLSMRSGWNREVRNRLSGARSCTHLVELLGPMATVAFQALGPIRIAGPDRLDAHGRPVMIDSCYAFAAHGDVVLRRWPQWHQRPEG